MDGVRETGSEGWQEEGKRVERWCEENRDLHKKGSNFLVGAICHSVTDGRWEWQVARATYVLAQMWENGALKAPEFFFGLPKGEKFFFTPCVQPKMLRFLWRIQIWVQNTKKVSTS